mmetsp:Transcript_49917/g.139754  ORF Transcript_49917/g.139754 Transcript_49917/m.139754 type:complete len:217 (+) Transcript_49917:1016-1666(+)
MRRLERRRHVVVIVLIGIALIGIAVASACGAAAGAVWRKDRVDNLLGLGGGLVALVADGSAGIHCAFSLARRSGLRRRGTGHLRRRQIQRRHNELPPLSRIPRCGAVGVERVAARHRRTDLVGAHDAPQAQGGRANIQLGVRHRIQLKGYVDDQAEGAARGAGSGNAFGSRCLARIHLLDPSVRARGRAWQSRGAHGATRPRALRRRQRLRRSHGP